MTKKPTKLYHATTPSKARRYKESGCIHAPVRGFDTLPAAMLWAMKVGRTVIYEFPVREELTHKLPDHHNVFGSAWWSEEDVQMSEVTCSCSAEAS